MHLKSEKVSYYECQTKQSSSRIGLNGEISVIGMVSAIQGPTQTRCNDWKLIVELISFVDEVIPRFDTIKLDLWIKETNIESKEKMIPKANMSGQMPVICVGDILFCDRIISISQDGLSWQVGADIDRNCLVVPRKTVGRLVQSKKKIEYCHFHMPSSCKKKIDLKRGIDAGGAKQELKTKLKSISSHISYYKSKIRSVENKNDTFGIVLGMLVVINNDTESIANVILDILPCEKNRSDQLSKINFEPKENIDENKSIIRIGEDFSTMVTTTARKRIILDYASSRAVLVQEIQPGSGVYMSGIEIDTTEQIIYNKLTQENIHSSVIVLPSSHPRVLSTTKLFSQHLKTIIDSNPDALNDNDN